MNDAAVRVENLSKQYRIGVRQERYRTLRDTVTDLLKAPFRRLAATMRGQAPVASSETIWALKGISLEIESGEVLGIIGPNGAGKTTLLKILSRITEPTEGRFELHGRVGSLLEVGTGFHPELTGRENIYLNGAILGMKRREIDRKFDEILAFSEVEKFMDTPVKRYSSGMRVRLAFSVAAHLEPEILLVDEVLSVGDAAFQRKCLGKMGNVAQEGRTVLFVSHNMGAVQSLCDRVIWLNDGEIREEGDPGQVVSNYLQAATADVIATEQVWDDRITAPGNDVVRLHRVCVRPENGSPSDPITMRTPVVMEFEIWNRVPDAYLNLHFHLLTEQGIVAFASAPPPPAEEPVWRGHLLPEGLFRSTCHIPGDLLNAGLYRVRLGVARDRRIVFRYENALSFEVQLLSKSARREKPVGVVRPLLKWSMMADNGQSGESKQVLNDRRPLHGPEDTE